MSRYNLNDKDWYYYFRDHWNRLAKREPSNPLVSVGFVLLANHCINNLVRFGPNGFNQSWGGATRGKMGLEKWEEYWRRRKANSVFLKCDFRGAPVGPEFFLYLDPPYSDAETAIYGQSWTREDDKDLVNLIYRHDQAGGKFVLSSLLRTEDGPGRLATRLTNFRQEPITKTYKASVGKHAKKEHVEGIITNCEPGV